jgi:hypothetical protein
MGNAFTSLIQGLSDHVKVQLAIEDERAARASFDGLVLHLEHLPESEQMLLAAPVAVLPAAGREACCLELLKGQYLFAETGGATLALDRDENFVFLQIAPSLYTLTRENFPVLVENFLNVAEAWRKRLERKPTEESREETHTSPPSLMEGFSWQG